MVLMMMASHVERMSTVSVRDTSSNPLYDDALREISFLHPTLTTKRYHSKGNAVRMKQREETTFAKTFTKNYEMQK